MIFINVHTWFTFSFVLFKLSMMSTAGSPTCLMETSAAVTSRISWEPPSPSPVLQALSWSKVQGPLSASIPVTLTGMTANLCAEVRLRIHRFHVAREDGNVDTVY